MTEKKQEVFMMNTGSLVELELSQRLIRTNIVAIGKEDPQRSKRLAHIFFYLNEHDKEARAILDALLSQPGLASDPIFIITNKVKGKLLKRNKLQIRPIIEISIDHYYAKIIEDYERIHAHLDDQVFADFEDLMEQIAQTIVKYINQKPEQRSYVVEEIKKGNHKPIIGVVGLGYVGLSVAVSFSKKYQVIGFDIDKEKIKSLNQNIDKTGEVTSEELRESQIVFTDQEQLLRSCKVLIIAVPTPITAANEPDLSFLINASKIVGNHLSPGSIVIYESTVFPGTTENVCIPVLENCSQLTSGVDFSVGYSPERMNPGDKSNTFMTINKVVAGQDKQSLEKTASLYQSILAAEVYQAPSIQVAEAAKLVENTQRDLNIAFMNELAMLFDKMNIETTEVLKAAQTKWNFLPFTPGLVGGHCIGVDPYYLIYSAKQVGYEPRLIQSGRQINETMPQFIVQQLLELIVKKKLDTNQLKVTVLGLTFKENVPDLRNSKALEIVRQLHDLGISVQACDPLLTDESLIDEDVILYDINQLDKAHIVLLTVPHNDFSYERSDFITNLLDEKQGIVMDIKGVIPTYVLPEHIYHWQP